MNNKITARETIIAWLKQIGCDQAEIDEVIEQCVADISARAYYLARAKGELE